MKILMIDGSPKPRNSNSAYFLGELEKLLPEGTQIQKRSVNQKKQWKDSFAEVAQTDLLVIAFPLYVDGIQSVLLQYLVELEEYLHAQERRRTIKVYVLSNCGFPEGIQNHLAIDMMKCWCHRAGLSWGCGIGIGGGEMMGGMKSVLPGTGPKKSLGKALKAFAALAAKQESGETIYCNPNFSRFLFVLVGNKSWDAQAKKIGISKKQMKRRAI